MGLTTAISAALSGLQATQQGLNLVADNVANANTPGYVRKTVQLVNTGAGSVGVQVVGISRELDQLVQRQLRSELAGGNYASTVNAFYQQVSQIFGTPGGNDALVLYGIPILSPYAAPTFTALALGVAAGLVTLRSWFGIEARVEFRDDTFVTDTWTRPIPAPTTFNPPGPVHE